MLTNLQKIGYFSTFNIEFRSFFDRYRFRGHELLDSDTNTGIGSSDLPLFSMKIIQIYNFQIKYLSVIYKLIHAWTDKRMILDQ